MFGPTQEQRDAEREARRMLNEAEIAQQAETSQAALDAELIGKNVNKLKFIGQLIEWQQVSRDNAEILVDKKYMIYKIDGQWYKGGKSNYSSFHKYDPANYANYVRIGEMSEKLREFEIQFALLKSQNNQLLTAVSELTTMIKYQYGGKEFEKTEKHFNDLEKEQTNG